MRESRNKLLNFFWPKIETKEKAELLIKMAAGFCIFISCASFAASLLYKYQVIDIPAFQSSWMSVFIYGPLAYFLYEKEKIAAWTALIYYVFDQIYTMTAAGGSPGFLMIIITCAFSSAIRALKFLDKQLQTEDKQTVKNDRLAS